MSIKEMYPSKGNTLNAADLAGRQHTLQISALDIANFTEGDKLVLKFEGKEKGLALNKTNAEIIASAFGDDEKQWIGNELIVYPDKTTFNGSLVDCIRVRVPTPDADPNDDIPF